MDDSLPIDDMDACETLPMGFENAGEPEALKGAVFTTGSGSPEVHMPPKVSPDRKDETTVASPKPLVIKPRALPPVPVFEPSQPVESDVP